MELGKQTRSEIKSKRIKGGIPNYISQAYMQELRANNKTKKVYEINPYVEVYRFRTNLFGMFAHNCDGAGDVWMYLIVGPQKAMLIDTCFGLGDLKGLCDLLTGGKELIVVNTHGHVDHAYGDCRFETIYCHEYEAPTIRQQDDKIFDYLFDDQGNNIWLDFDKEDLPKFKPFQVIPVKDGHIFDLGEGYEVELLWLGGHAPGNSGFLDKQNRIFFTGDDLCSDISGVASGPKADSINGQYMNLETFRNNLKKVVDRRAEFDSVFPSHFVVDIDAAVLESELQTCDEILEDPNCYDYKATTENPKGDAPNERYFKYIKGFGVLAYKMEGIHPVKEEKLENA